MSLPLQFIKYFFVKEKYHIYTQIKTALETSNYDKPALS